MSRYQKGKTNLDFTEARDSEWQWHQLGRMQVCTSLQTDNHTRTPQLSFYRPDALPAAEPTASKHWRHTIAARYIFALIWSLLNAKTYYDTDKTQHTGWMWHHSRHGRSRHDSWTVIWKHSPYGRNLKGSADQRHSQAEADSPAESHPTAFHRHNINVEHHAQLMWSSYKHY